MATWHSPTVIGSLYEIATPVCALARNDNYYVFAINVIIEARRRFTFVTSKLVSYFV